MASLGSGTVGTRPSSLSAGTYSPVGGSLIGTADIVIIGPSGPGVPEVGIIWPNGVNV